MPSKIRRSWVGGSWLNSAFIVKRVGISLNVTKGTTILPPMYLTILV